MVFSNFFKENFKLAEPMLILFYVVIVFCLTASYIHIITYNNNIDKHTKTLIPLYYIIAFFSFFIILNKLQLSIPGFLASSTFNFQMFMFIYHITLLVFVTMEYKINHLHLFFTKFFMTVFLFLSILTKKNDGESSYAIEHLEMFFKVITWLLILTYIYMFFRTINSTRRS